MSNATAPRATLAREQTVIENSILNSPFEEPQAHFRFDENGITDQVVHERRLSSYFCPSCRPAREVNTTSTRQRIECRPQAEMMIAH
jgi:hypothetical protein